jgi:hypothetical protein
MNVTGEDAKLKKDAILLDDLKWNIEEQKNLVTTESVVDSHY